MQLDTLREFADLAVSLNFTKTARERFISQSVLSKHISALERELGVRLFERDQHGVELTDAGALFHDRIQPLLSMFDSAIDDMHALTSKSGRTLRLGYLRGASKAFLGTAYGAFRLDHPSINLELVQSELDEGMGMLKNEDIDVAITAAVDMRNTQGYNMAFLYEDGFGVLVSRKHRIARCGAIGIDDLAGECIGVMGSSHSPTYTPFIERALAERGFEEPVQLPAADIGSIPIIASADDSMAVIVPLHLRLLYDSEDQVVIPLHDGKLKQTICMLWKPERESAELLDLVEIMKCEAARAVCADVAGQ